MSTEKTDAPPIDKNGLFALLDAMLLKMKISIIETAPQIAVRFNIDVETAREMLTEWAYKPHIECGDE